jgi:hypothetical protein
MPNHFEAVGFPIRDREQMGAFAVRAADEGVPVRTADGDYHRWAPGAGAELWALLDGNSIVGLTPHFAGATSLRVGIVGRVVHPDDLPLEGCLHAWVNPPDDGDADTGEYPLVFAVPDFRALDGLALPARARVQVAAFAHDLDVYASEEAYMDGQASELKFAAESFIPSGMFTDDEDAPPTPHAMISGVVLAAEQRTNPAGDSFWWMHVRTLGGEIDVVAGTALVDAAPVPGGVVSGSFYLSGRVTPDAPESRGG